MTNTPTFHELNAMAQASAELFQKEISGSQLKISYRKINNWNEEGLFPFKISDGKWRTFSFLEACWVKVISELRLLGLSISSIRHLKEQVAQVMDLRDIFNDPEFSDVLRKKRKWNETDVKQVVQITQSLD